MSRSKLLKKFERGAILKRRFLKFANLLIFIAITLGLMGGLYYIFGISDFFKISNIEIIGAKSFVNHRDIKEVLQTKLYGKNILTIDVNASEKALSNTFLGAKNITLERKFPNRIDIIVNERVPLALIYNSNSPNVFMIDEDGYALGIVDENTTNLAKIRYEGDIKVGMFINKTLIPVYLELTKVLSKEEIKATSMSFYPRHVELFLNTGVKALLSSEKSITNSIGVLVSMLRQISLEGRQPRNIDLRYDKVIVSYD